MKPLFDLPVLNGRPPILSEPMYGRLARLPDEPYARCRAIIEDWFIHYPADGQTELAARFRNTDDRAHLAAFFELYLHELLYRQGCTVKLHPSVSGSTKVPDFGVTDGTGNAFYLEAVLALEEAEVEFQGQARLRQVYDYINAHLFHPDFSLVLQVQGLPKSLPPMRNLVNFLQGRLTALDFKAEVARQGLRRRDREKEWSYEHDGMTIHFYLYPKPPHLRGVADVRPLSGWINGVRAVGVEDALRRAIKKKASRYGKLDLPYVIAINALSPFADRMAYERALFGEEQLLVYLAQPPSEINHAEWGRKENGFWHNTHGATASRVSGVLLMSRVYPTDFEAHDTVLYHNPTAASPLRSALSGVTEAKVENSLLVYSDK